MDTGVSKSAGISSVIGRMVCARGLLLVLPDSIYERGRKIMENRGDGSNFQTDKMVRKIYDDCVDERGREKAGLKPAKHFLLKFGGWPVLDLPRDTRNYR